ncbi:MAG: nucleotide pyrophosphohydrolase [Candidatus Aenigmarchaeota archaeon]|nr:nucleotide pyrophosphohydrolase [Candidatus Aenigmarchaeota archaeon]
MNDENTRIYELKEKVRKFCEERDWDQFHKGKELVIALVIEIGELLEHFRWKSELEIEGILKDKKKREEIEDEVADIFYFLLRFAQKNNIDLSEALERKMKKNEEKYPVSKFKGLNKKYTEVV